MVTSVCYNRDWGEPLFSYIHDHPYLLYLVYFVII